MTTIQAARAAIASQASPVAIARAADANGVEVRRDGAGWVAYGHFYETEPQQTKTKALQAWAYAT